MIQILPDKLFGKSLNESYEKLDFAQVKLGQGEATDFLALEHVPPELTR